MEVQLQAALITAGAVVLGLVVQALLAVRTLRQRSLSDDREARWARIQWAVDRALEGSSSAQEVGAVALEVIVDEEHLDARDKAVVVQTLAELAARQLDAFEAWEAAAEEALAEGADEPQDGGAGDPAEDGQGGSGAG